MAKKQVRELLTRWALSTDTNRREIARAVLRSAESVNVAQSEICEANDAQLEIALLEFIHKPLLGEKTGEFLLGLAPGFENAGGELREKLKREMTLQAINHPACCLDKWKKIAEPSVLLREVIRDAEAYFERLRAVADSAAVAFSFPGFKEAAEKEREEFLAEVDRGAREKSIFARLAKNVQIIYGSKWAVMMQGKLGAPTGFHELSREMEFPRLEVIDAEGMVIRRIEARNRVRELTGGGE